MAELNDITLAKLARELVMNIRNYKLVFKDYGITEADYAEIAQNEFFKKVKEQYTIEWNASTSTEDRLKIGSMAYLEQLFPALTRRALEATEALPAATGVANLLMRTAGLGVDNKQASANTDRFVITINLGADSNGKEITEKYDKSIEINPNDTDQAALADQGKQAGKPAKTLRRPADPGAD